MYTLCIVIVRMTVQQEKRIPKAVPRLVVYSCWLIAIRIFLCSAIYNG